MFVNSTSGYELTTNNHIYNCSLGVKLVCHYASNETTAHNIQWIKYSAAGQRQRPLLVKEQSLTNDNSGKFNSFNIFVNHSAKYACQYQNSPNTAFNVTVTIAGECTHVQL